MSARQRQEDRSTYNTLLLRFGIVHEDEKAAEEQARTFIDTQAAGNFWADGYELRHAKRFTSGREFRFEAWGRIDPENLKQHARSLKARQTREMADDAIKSLNLGDGTKESKSGLLGLDGKPLEQNGALVLPTSGSGNE